MIALPPQQMKASRAYFGDEVHGGENNAFDSYVLGNSGDGRRGSFYDDPWREKIAEDDLWRLSSLTPVNRSDASLAASSKSRVTSWTNTATSGSLGDNPVERKRLSVIQEDGGPHQPSSSAGMHLGGVSVFRKPLPVPPSQAPDPQRLYSALVRRMNQESADREKAEGAPGKVDTMPSAQERTVRAVTSSTSADIRPCRDPNTIPRINEKPLHSVSQESIYSGCDGGAQFGDIDACAETSKVDLQSGFVPFQSRDLNVYRLANRSNPYHSDLDLSEVVVTEAVDECVQQPWEAHNPALARQQPVKDAQYHVMPKPEINTSQTSIRSKTPSHVREDAQIESENTRAFSGKAVEKAAGKSFKLLHKTSKGTDIPGSRTPTPLSTAPDQLLVAKRRFPLLNVKQVSRNHTPIPNRSGSLTRSQSGLLQQVVSSQDNSKERNGPENVIIASLRKISPENVANMLKSKKSLGVLHYPKHEKENKPHTRATTPEADWNEPYAVSTPGPSYLAIRSGNSPSREDERPEQKAAHQSPTDVVKATLSARLSRPFNMDTPELNRPFDSMYLGKRELGFSDVAGGRLSVAPKSAYVNAAPGCVKGRSFERGPGGYGGLGPVPFDGSGATKEAETALPHIPSPEDRLKHKGSKVGLSLGSKRMVSNFLRNRRKGTSSNEVGASHDEHARTPDPNGTSPLFI